jgi:hypothetical protein
MNRLIIATLFLSATQATAPAAAQITGQPTRPDECGASTVKAMMGKKASTTNVDRIARISGAETIRVIKFRQPVTADYRPTRLNVSLNKKGQIRQLSCG